MSEKLLRQWIKASLLEQAAYAPSCQYEVDMNQKLAAAGARSAYAPPSDPNFCYGTDTGGDAEFIALDFDGNKGTYALELKAGESAAPKGIGNPGWSHPTAQNMLQAISSFNNIAHVSNIVRRDIEASNGKGLILTGDYDEVPEDTIKEISDWIIAKQASEINTTLTGASGKKGVDFYYYFIRTGNAQSDLSIPKPFDLSKPDQSLVGSFEQKYASSGTNYIQIENAGLFYMGADPLNLASIGALNFTGNVKTAGRNRVTSSGGKDYWDLFKVTALKDGMPVKIDCEVRYKTKYFKAVEDIKSSKSMPSGINLDNPADLERFAAYVTKPAVRPKKASNESLIRDLIRSILSEGGSRGHKYEGTIVSEVNAAGIPGLKMEANDTTAWDLNAYATSDPDGKPTKAKIEVKLGPADQLGKIWKESFDKLSFDPASKTWIGEMKAVGSAMSAGKGENHTITQADVDLGEHLINVLNNDPRTSAEMMKMINNDPMTFPNPTTEIDLRKTISSQMRGKSPKGGGYSITGGLRNDDYRTQKQQLDYLKKALRSGDISQEEFDAASSEAEEMDWNLELLIPAEDVTHIFDAKVNYLIVGNGAGSESACAGRIGVVGPDVLGTGAAPIEFSDSRIEIRWGNKGSKAKPSYNFTIETRAANVTIAGGSQFSSGLELAKILSSNSIDVDRESRRSPIGGQGLGLPSANRRRQGQGSRDELNDALIRNMVSNILYEELTKSDKREIDRLIKKGIEKDRAEQKKIIQKELESELKRSLGTSFFRQPGKIRKAIEDVCREELAKEMRKGSDLEKSVVDVTKRVMTAWHELMYKQKHIIQRVKI